ncbi:MAG: hypothetical protein A2087_10285 [Spirochaetes bacterium GWD1_61_31]|nr:MAG: hypothetical protein A2Y37_12230 [Spirochaetes bacterium GWB1_60_80]OHD30140.1 MAG: hypothetical protein A2004_14095 [Spirochaetes bacterium GWC1_61_12]OHD34605.1 MAG: hypothetical protein A2087_10285 [Spirochaetes bacterium GWD1_61_31]OHD46421.1 MAG: hypothetical protein A2Y35_10190 [Spirochaetes bacterium GWE1_60_18]OHD59477.1 MAG: hypothetical protein A2Y32_10145 [Spirochaetes bacterium GWF1_60_12]HAW86093.1 DUF4037 domain-containing protein [Spirochaetaceae bacterium]
MKHKVELVAERLTQIMSAWSGVNCILSCDASDTDVIDPYFALVLDVYCDGPIPPAEQRQTAFDNPGAFETSGNGRKDRFFLDSLPIHLEYKETSSLDALQRSDCDYHLFTPSSGTYFLYRIVHGTILFRKDAWVERLRQALAALPEAFWGVLRESCQNKLEHSLSDLGGAAFKHDRYFYFVSLAGFLKACTASLFAINKCWQPSNRNLTECLLDLPALPEDFAGRWEGLTRTDARIVPERMFQLAQLIARSMIKL